MILRRLVPVHVRFRYRTKNSMPTFDVINLHVGMPKTGTTAFQATLFHDREKIQAAGIYVPPTIGHRHRHLQLFASRISPKIRQLTSRKFDKLPETTETIQAYLDHLVTNGSGFDKAIMSEETVFSLSAEELQNLKEALSAHCRTIKILITFRDPSEYIKSNYYQRIKGANYFSDVFEFKKAISPTLGYKNILEKFRGVFGDSNVECFIYDKDIVNRIYSFLDVNNLNIKDKNTTPSRVMEVYIKAMLNLMVRNRVIDANAFGQRDLQDMARKISEVISKDHELAETINKMGNLEFLGNTFEDDMKAWEDFKENLSL